MKKLFFTLALAAGLAACAAPQSAQQTVFAAKTTYASALTAAVAYKRLPTCSETVKAPCKLTALVEQLQKADTTAAAALDAAEFAVRTPIVGATATQKALSAAQTALAALTAVVTNLGVTQ